MFCKNCGNEVDANAFVCPSCGVKVQDESHISEKSKVLAGILGLFLGTFGVHNFYLGYTSKAVAQLLITIVGACVILGPMITGIWSFVEAIMIFMGNIKDSDGKELRS